MLIEAGYPADEIALVNGKTCKASGDRQVVSNSFNSGKYTMVIGTTAVMGEGLNFQMGTSDIHHLTIPWTPADLEQREGRGVRQGNPLEEVNVHTYGLQGSFDQYRASLVERKKGWITDLWFGDADTAINGSELSDEEMDIALAKDPEAAAAAAAARQQDTKQKFQEFKAQEAMGQFARYQGIKAAYDKIKPESRGTKEAKRLMDQMSRMGDALRVNEWFPHKDLLGSEGAVWVSQDRTQIIQPGDLIRNENGSIMRVTGVDVGSNNLTGVEVLGKSNSSRFNVDKERLQAWSGSQIDEGKITPISNADLEAEIIGAVDSVENLNHLTPAQIDANRERLVGQMYSGWIKDEDGGIKYTYGQPTVDTIVWPHTPEFRERAFTHLARSQGFQRGELTHLHSWSTDTRKLVEAIAAADGIPNWRQNSDWQLQMTSKLYAYKEQHERKQRAQTQAADKERSDANERMRLKMIEIPSDYDHAAALETVRQGLEHLISVDPDGAKELNGLGFSKIEGSFGRDLAGTESWSDKQAVAAAKLTHGHRRQLARAGIVVPHPDHIAAYQQGSPAPSQETTTPDAPTPAPIHPVVAPWRGGKQRVEHAGDKMHLYAPYDKTMNTTYRSAGGNWNQVSKRWEFPFSSHSQLEGKLRGFDWDPKLKDEPRIHEAPPVKEEQKGQIKLVGGQYHVSFPYEESAVSKMRGIKQRHGGPGWNKPNSRWQINASESSLEALQAAFPDFDLIKALRQGDPIPRRILYALA